MIREIKFRAWDENSKRMTHTVPRCVSFDDVCLLADMLEGNDGLIPMQFTGLHDKNGKEIYEGDIVQTIDQMEATYNELDSNVGVGEVEVLHGFWNVGGHVCNGLYDLDDMYHIEVIGNVHENPELLEESA